MADLEKLAIKRDRGYLVRLIILLVLGALGGGYIFVYLTGSGFSGCVTDAYMGTTKSSKPESE